jgi:uncharacterized protein (DUF488 family)
MEVSSKPVIFTVGHSTRTAEELIRVLRAYDIELLVDVRRFPGSRRLPQFGSAELKRSLEAADIDMLWLPSLGGRRRPVPDSPNTGWRVDGFRGYADHTETPEFADGMFELMMPASGVTTAIMCAEILWWQCHRRLISDALVYLGWPVIHIRDEYSSSKHVIAEPARVINGVLTWAADTQLEFL